MSLFNFPKFPKFEPHSLHINKPEIYESIINDIEYIDPHEVTNKIYDFLKYQSDITYKQFKTSRNLIIATIIIMLIQISIASIDIFLSYSEQKDSTKLIETQSLQSEAISRMSLDLLDLQNRVQTLEKEKSELLLKLNSVKK
jgi:hypothetical protein